jgi:NAD(P)-dependent dehydrogenase (short-subunit alcohol dehydrogenase family)
MVNNPFSLEGKTVLVAGASSGIGYATAIECSRMGASLIISGRNQERLEACMNCLGGGKNEIFKADLTVKEELESLVAHSPQLDGVVISAGKGITLPIKSASIQKYQDIFDINFFATTELLRLLFKHKKLNSQASVVIISSIGGTRQFEPANAIYGTSKAAITAFMKFAAIEWAVKGIRVNAVCPGMVETPLMTNGRFSEEQLNAYRETYPLKRFGKPEEIGYAVVYLLSNASSWVTGTSLIVDGGSTIRC